MNGEKFKKISELLGEGFFADHLTKTRNKSDIEMYVSNIKRGYLVLNTGEIDLQSLHRFIRFITWINFRYGQVVVKSKKEAVAFLNDKIESLITDSAIQDEFFGWLQKITLNETSRLMM